jgi:hypothetical protein
LQTLEHLLSGKTQSVGFEVLTRKRAGLSSTTQLDANPAELGKLLPKSIGMSIPFYGSISKPKAHRNMIPMTGYKIASDRSSALPNGIQLNRFR